MESPEQPTSHAENVKKMATWRDTWKDEEWPDAYELSLQANDWGMGNVTVVKKDFAEACEIPTKKLAGYHTRDQAILENRGYVVVDSRRIGGYAMRHPIISYGLKDTPENRMALRDIIRLNMDVEFKQHNRRDDAVIERERAKIVGTPPPAGPAKIVGFIDLKKPR